MHIRPSRMKRKQPICASCVKRKSLEAAVQHWAEPLSAERLFGWHAAPFPTGRSGITPIVVGGWRDHPEPMQIVTPRLGRPDVVHYQAPDSSDVPAHMARHAKPPSGPRCKPTTPSV